MINQCNITSQLNVIITSQMTLLVFSLLVWFLSTFGQCYYTQYGQYGQYGQYAQYAQYGQP